jgi:hypothetical protein
MPSTHTSLHFHLIFSTKGRHPLISETWRYRLHAYLEAGWSVILGAFRMKSTARLIMSIS